MFFGISKIETHMEWIINETDKFKSSFMEYSYLWMEDLNKTFSEFLEQGAKSANPDEEEDFEKLEKLKSHPIFEGVTMIIPELELFDEKITNLKYI
mmetsp:Transcript_26845/g.4868  ORF Transcript_26845/g.4868 Transcript_26845/m.4868 type:complete len:96 (+) Transcript_26845:2889-3176(+)